MYLFLFYIFSLHIFKLTCVQCSWRPDGIPWIWCYGQLLLTRWILGTETKSSARTTNVLNHQASLQALFARFQNPFSPVYSFYRMGSVFVSSFSVAFQLSRHPLWQGLSLRWEGENLAIELSIFLNLVY